MCSCLVTVIPDISSSKSITHSKTIFHVFWFTSWRTYRLGWLTQNNQSSWKEQFFFCYSLIMFIYTYVPKFMVIRMYIPKTSDVLSSIKIFTKLFISFFTER